MVHLQDARPAYSAMVAAVWLVLATPFAVSSRFAVTLHLLQIHSSNLILIAPSISSVLPHRIIVRNLTWMLQDTSNVADQQQACDYVKDNRVNHASMSSICAPKGMCNIVLKHRYDVMSEIEKVEDRNRTTDESYW